MSVTVWVVEEGKYDFNIVLIADSLNAAVAGLKRKWSLSTEWGDVVPYVYADKERAEAFIISAKFPAIPGRYTQRISTFHITPYRLTDMTDG